MTMTQDAVRTYAVGDDMGDLFRLRGAACWTSDGGYVCNLPTGHTGPQHVAAINVGERKEVCHVWDRDTSGDEPTPEPIVEQPTPEVLAERLATAVEVNDNLDRQVRELRDELVNLRGEHDEFRQRVVDTAMELARRHDWCSVVQRGLEDMGLGDLLTRKFRVQVTVKAERTVYVEVEARESGDAWRMVDNMSASELADAIDATGEISSYRFYDNSEWEHESHDSSTDVDEV